MARCALSKDDEIALKAHAESLGMIYISTPFSRAAADFLAEIGVAGFKIGSGECNHVPLIRHIASFGKPVILSTGMQTIESLRPSVQALDDAGIDYALLECTNLYPSPPEIVSLQGITELRKRLPARRHRLLRPQHRPRNGAIASVALGACILERHFTDTRYRKGPDIPCSMDPAELRFLIDRSKEIHTALHNPKVRTAPGGRRVPLRTRLHRGRQGPARRPCGPPRPTSGPADRARARSRCSTSTAWSAPGSRAP